MFKHVLLAIPAVLLMSLVIGVALWSNIERALPDSTVTNPPNSQPVVPTQETEEDAGFTVIIGGDVMFARYVETQINRHSGQWLTDEIKAVTSAADLTLVNLESPFLINGQQTADDSLILRAHPAGLNALTNAGIDGVSLANNHIPDMGLQGLNDTISLLDSAQIKHTGAGTSSESAQEPMSFTVGSTKIAVLSYTYGTNFDRTGVFYNLANSTQAAADIKKAKTNHDVVIVMPHFGTEYASQPSSAQTTFARACIDAGASVVAGAHPHIPQPIEQYNGGVIAYSLGNLVFDQEPASNKDRSALLKLTFKDNQLATLGLLPYQIYSLSQPKFVSGVTAKQIFELFALPGGQLTF